MHVLLKQRRGFTLIELVLTLMLVGVLGGAYLMYTGNLANVSLDALTQKARGDIRYAQQLATATQINHGVIFTAGSGYSVYKQNAANIILSPVTGKPMTEDLSAFSGASIDSHFTVEFTPSGAPLPINGNNYVQMSGGGTTSHVYVQPITGAVEVDRTGLTAGCSYVKAP